MLGLLGACAACPDQEKDRLLVWLGLVGLLELDG